ncbi:hypothetical protein ABBQ32_004628 [Trebouxia sp. C0010 RCD-2024]
MAKRFFAKVVSQDTVQGVFEKLGSKMDYKAGFSAAAATVASTAAVVMYKSGSLREVVKSLRQTLRKTYKSSTTTAEKTSECLTARWTRFCFISLAFNNHQSLRHQEWLKETLLFIVINVLMDAQTDAMSLLAVPAISWCISRATGRSS